MLATAKVPNLKANHNSGGIYTATGRAVLATAKVPNLKANHNLPNSGVEGGAAVLATAKVPNLKANHNHTAWDAKSSPAVLATAKVPNLKANHKDHFPYLSEATPLPSEEGRKKLYRSSSKAILVATTTYIGHVIKQYRSAREAI